ncbi:MAG: endolytic transglycosylase MltG [Rickettsiales bacterium]
MFLKASVFGKAVLISVLLTVCLALYSYHYYTAPGPLSERTTVLFKKGTGFVDIVDKMEEAGVIDHSLLFKALAVFSGDARQFKAGEYRFSAAISPRLVMEMIAKGRVVVHKVTIPEGMNVRQVIKRLNGRKLLEGVIVMRIEEGSLLPQTYHYVYGDQRMELINRMQTGMQATLDELWPNRAKNLPFITQQQALTLASIVEKETNLDSEYGRVAAVYINRLRKGMRLQADPTVIYGIEQKTGKPMGRLLTYSDLKKPTPYNTYINTGLPPTPIANPGRKAIEAVLNPPKTKELFFVATGDGGHNFATTLAQHNRNVAAYRKKRREKAKQ